ncbi:MAG: hypothetical protein ACYDHM_11685 [Acidiferrobacterales bacterium]
MAIKLNTFRQSLPALIRDGAGMLERIADSRTGRAFVFIAMVVLAVVAYYPGLSGGFVFDDFPNILNNAQLQIHRLTWQSLWSASLSSQAGILRRPISMLTFALNYYFFGIKPFSFKLVNLIIHLANGIGLFILGSQVLNVYRQIHRPALSERQTFWIALSASAAWLLHPLNFTGVMYVVQRMTSLSTLFTIAGLCFYLWGRWRLWNRRKGLGLMLTGVVGFGLLALLSKESGALLPVYMLVIEFTLFRFRTSDGGIDKTVRWFFLLFLMLPALGGLIWMASDPGAFFGGYVFRTFTPLQRVLTEARVIVFYLRLIFVPSLNQLGLYHDNIAISHGLLHPPTTLASILLIVTLLGTAVMVRRRAPLVSFGILWFFTGQLLESTVLPLEIAFEHRNYLADYGILLPLCCTLLDARHAVTTLTLRRVALALYIAMLCTITYMRSENWSSTFEEAITEARFHPDSPQSLYDAGRIYANLALTGHQQFTKDAYRYLERSARLDTAGIMADVGLIIFAGRHGDPINQQWITVIGEKLGHDPISPSTIASLRQLQACQQGPCRVGNSQMMALFRDAFHNPILYRTTQQHADMLTIYGSFLINKLDDFADGKVVFKEAVRIDPGQLQYRDNLTRLLIAMHLYRDARSQLAALAATDSLHQYNAQIKALGQELARLPDRNLRLPAARRSSQAVNRRLSVIDE